MFAYYYLKNYKIFLKLRKLAIKLYIIILKYFIFNIFENDKTLEYLFYAF